MTDMQIFINSLDGSTFTLDVNGALSLADVKMLIFDKWGIPPSIFRIIYHGKQFPDETILNEIKVSEHDTLYIYGVMR